MVASSRPYVAPPPGLEEYSWQPNKLEEFSTLLEPAYVNYTGYEAFATAGKHGTQMQLESDNLQAVGNLLKAAATCIAPGETAWYQQQQPTWLADYAFAGYNTSPAKQDNPLCKNKKDRRAKRRNVLLIATHLNELQAEDPTRILIVRKINRLGFDSADILKEHFERFGPVNKVRLSNAHDRQQGQSLRFRVRPSGIAFLLFEDAQDCARALAAGESQIIADQEVFVRSFQRRRSCSDSTIDDEMFNGKDADTGDEEVVSNLEHEDAKSRTTP